MSSPTPSTLRVGRRYRAKRLDGPYDAIVIGSGIGGLTAAACLSKMGKKVVVFEQHYTAGGFTHSYDRNGYEWDVGVHYIGDMGADHTMAKRLFDQHRRRTEMGAHGRQLRPPVYWRPPDRPDGRPQGFRGQSQKRLPG